MHLCMLHLNINNIGDDGAKALSEDFTCSNNLKLLDLSCNYIGDDGAIAVARATESFTDLRLLIWNYTITKHGTDTIAGIKCKIL